MWFYYYLKKIFDIINNDIMILTIINIIFNVSHMNIDIGYLIKVLSCYRNIFKNTNI